MYILLDCIHSAICAFFIFRLRVTCDNIFLHFIEPKQFLDSIEYDALAFDTDNQQLSQCFQVGWEDKQCSQQLLKSYTKLGDTPFSNIDAICKL